MAARFSPWSRSPTRRIPYKPASRLLPSAWGDLPHSFRLFLIAATGRQATRRKLSRITGKTLSIALAPESVAAFRRACPR